MSTGILGLGSGNASTLNQEMIDKLKAVDTKTFVDPITKKIEKITSVEEGEEGEEFKIFAIKEKVAELASSMGVLSLSENGEANVFDNKSSNVTGTSAVFSSDNISLLPTGTISVDITQLASKDVYQTNSFNDKTEEIPLSSPQYESRQISKDTANDKVGAGEFTITPDGGSAISFTTDENTTWDDLKTMINDEDNLEASFVDNRLIIKESNSKELEIKDTSGSVMTDLGIESVANITIQVASSPVYQSHITSNSTSTDKVGAGEFTITPDGGSAISFTTDENTTWDDLKTMINDEDNLEATLINGRLSISHTDGKTELSFSDTSGNVTTYLGLKNKGRIFSTIGKTYENLAKSIDNDDKISASVEQVGDDSYRLVIKSKESGTANALTINQTAVDLKLNENANHILTAQNLNATIDGVSYNISSNQIKTAGDLTITATELGKSSLTISENTDLIVPAVSEFIKNYNDLVDMIDKEVSSADSPISDISSLQSMMSSIKRIIFDNYGENHDLNIFGISMEETQNTNSVPKAGLILSKTGSLVLDETIFSSTVSKNMDKIKSLFVGTATNKGLGTKLKEFLEGLSKQNGILKQYEESMDKRLEKLNEEKEKMIKTLDTRYSSMASDFASYGAIITQMEAQFSGLKLMIQQSIASK